MARILGNTVSPDQLLEIEIEVLNNLIGDLPKLVSPLDIIKDVASLLNLRTANALQNLLNFSFNIVNFVYWSKWGSFSTLSISVAVVVIFSELNGLDEDVIKLVKFGREFDIEDTDKARNFILKNFINLSDNTTLLKRVAEIVNKSLLDI